VSDVGDLDLDVPLAAAARGDQGAVNQVLRTISPLILRYCRSRLGRAGSSYHSADDVAQEVCLAVALALPRYYEQGRPFLAYVYRIAANKVVDAHRADERHRFDPVHPIDVPTGSSTRLDRGETHPPRGLRLVNAARALRESLLSVLDLEAGLAEATQTDRRGRVPTDAPEPSRPVGVGPGNEATPATHSGAPASPTPHPTRPEARRSTALPRVAPWTDAPPPHPARRQLLPEAEQRTFPEPEDHALHLESLSWARELLDLLPERQREILILRVVNGFSAEETARTVGSTPGAIRVAQHRALAQLRHALAGGAFRPKRVDLGARPGANKVRPLAG
jgi:RNA polymerase sigma factor (sigma-70 family)